MPVGVIGVRGEEARKLGTQGERHSFEIFVETRRLEELLFEWGRLRCEGEFGRSDEFDDCLLNEGAASAPPVLIGIVRTVNFGTSRSADVVSSRRKFGTLPFRCW